MNIHEFIAFQRQLNTDLIQAVVEHDWPNMRAYAEPVVQAIVDFVMTLEPDILDRLKTLQKEAQ